MDKKKYLRQAYRLDHKIQSEMREVENLKEMAGSPQSPSLEPHYNPNKQTEAYFVKCYRKIWDLEEKIESEILLLTSLKEQIHETIETVPDKDEQMVLRYRYIEGMSWEDIGVKLYAGRSTVNRWHDQALEHMKMPDVPIWL